MKDPSHRSQLEELLLAFTCPISQKLIEEPMTSKFGHLYEKREIERWIQKYHTCPMTNQPLDLADIQPAPEVKQALSGVLQMKLNSVELS